MAAVAVTQNPVFPGCGIKRGELILNHVPVKSGLAHSVSVYFTRSAGQREVDNDFPGRARDIADPDMLAIVVIDLGQ
jgi:hypothetical protein